jgi:hypothetical protein
MSINPVRHTPDSAPPVPESAHAPVSRVESGSLLERTAHLFDQSPTPGGEVMRSFETATSGDASSELRRFLQDPGRASGLAEAAVTPVHGRPEPPPPALDMDEVVERVVRKIEERVVDELERRGRRYGRGAF